MAASAAGASAPGRGVASAVQGAQDTLALWGEQVQSVWSQVWADVRDEARSLLRVTRIDQPEAMLMAPEQAFFLRENLKLRLLNARLSLLSRQPESATVDLQSAQRSLQTYFDGTARRTQIAMDLLRAVTAQSRLVGIPRPDESLAATAAAVAGR